MSLRPENTSNIDEQKKSLGPFSRKLLREYIHVFTHNLLLLL